jgi:outer membrane protein assembly factor BamE (lipoprotein component of BamABCDE complex)
MKAVAPSSHRPFPVLVLIALLGLSGCTTSPIHGADPQLLDFLKDGATTRDEVVLALGQPSATLQQEHIVTYRIGEDSDKRRFVVTPQVANPWARVNYSLVLVFDDAGTLQKHNLVPVQ